jgi:hypothetical protein
MADHKISLVLADVDGTLVTRDKVLTERARAAVAALHAAGIRFAITSGRPPRGMEMLTGPLALQTPIAGFNGGVFAHPDLSIIEQKTLAPDVAAEAIDFLRSSGLDAWVYTGRDWLITNPDAPHVKREAWTVQFPPTVVPDYDGHLDKAVKIVGISDDLAKVAAAETAAGAGALAAKATARRSEPYYLDITDHDANKGAVADFMSRTLGVPEPEIATIGDQPSDVLMFKRSGLSIAMGNASDAVKAQATRVTASYDDEGFAKAMERFVLGPG